MVYKYIYIKNERFINIIDYIVFFFVEGDFYSLIL